MHIRKVEDNQGNCCYENHENLFNKSELVSTNPSVFTFISSCVYIVNGENVLFGGVWFLILETYRFLMCSRASLNTYFSSWRIRIRYICHRTTTGYTDEERNLREKKTILRK